MPLDHLPLKSITIGHIRSLIENEEVEDRKIEYKQDYRASVTPDGDVCSDISAFANGIGGDILYGVPEKSEEGNKTAKPSSALG
jgi:predicted HTH transcriptional regulator